LSLLSGKLFDGKAFQYSSPDQSDKAVKDQLKRISRAIARLLPDARVLENGLNGNPAFDQPYDRVLHAWTKVLELRDFETLEHTKRVTKLSVNLARQMGIDEAELVHMRRGAMLHDIGKLGIPDTILLKRGPLTQVERQIMQQHPVFAYLMLSPIEFLHPALDIPLSHHEKWDGTGYPYGLKGENIPIVARIFSIVDVWDALNSSRPYRPSPWPKREIIKHLIQESGSHFDPIVVQAFLSLNI
jgi:putative nucleotidyltransferase with HDIG domain